MNLDTVALEVMGNEQAAADGFYLGKRLALERARASARSVMFNAQWLRCRRRTSGTCGVLG